MENYNELKKAVIKQLGSDDIVATLRDVAENGADVGFGGFTYYSDTSDFYGRNRDLIWELLESEYEEFGEGNIIEFIGTFNGAKNVGNELQFFNLLSWYALEYIARTESVINFLNIDG